MVDARTLGLLFGSSRTHLAFKRIRLDELSRTTARSPRR